MTRSYLAGLALALSGLAAPLAAQTPIDFTPQLDRLHEAVMGVAASSHHFDADLAQVARLHAHLTGLRTPSDPRLVECLMDQASLALGVGDLTGARRWVAEAVAQAEWRGDVLKAAQASVTAAVLAQQAGDFATEKTFRINARNLALSPSLSLAETSAIVSRLYGEAWKAGLRVDDE